MLKEACFLLTRVTAGDGISHLVSENSDNRHAYRVPVCTLDQFTASRNITKIHFLKVDAEGYDLAVLEGATSLLRSGAIDIFMFEFNAVLRGISWLLPVVFKAAVA